MIFFAWSTAGVAAFEKLRRDNLDCQLWVRGGLLTQQQLTTLRSTGARVTAFTCDIGPEHADTITYAISVIREHHPNESIWVES
jgi:hypothetical protein